jgi:hypothetical protein
MKKRFWFTALIITCVSLLIISDCKRYEVPTVATAEISDISATTATCGGEIISEGTSKIIGRGVCWNTDQNPTIADSKSEKKN